MSRPAADYAGAIRALMPRGRAWPNDPDTVQSRVIAALAQTPARVDQAAGALLDGSLPGNNLDLIPEWEATLDLPDPCAGPNPTLAARAFQVRARFVGSPGQSVGFFIAFAAALGFKITITTWAAFQADVSAVETPLYGDDWFFAWGVHVVANTGGLSTDVLLCELDTLKPAHTYVFLI